MKVTPLPPDAWGPGLIRQRVRVRYAGSLGEEELWIAVPEALAALAPSGNPWAAALLPLAMTMGEDLDLELPVCPTLDRNLGMLQAIWRSWYPRLHAVRLSAPAEPPLPQHRERGTGLFFSGGVDSAYSLVQCLRGGDRAPDLLMVWGADVTLSRRDVFDTMLDRYRRLAEQYHLTLQPLATNLRETRWGKADWAGLAHGALFAACGLAMADRYEALLLAASDNSVGTWIPLGSHPVTDPLFSTATTRLVHHGIETRAGKCAALAGFEPVLAGLRVCWETQTGSNCGRCEKCLRTMLALELAGLLPACSLFPAPRVDLGRVRNLRITRPMYERRYLPTVERARAAGRADLVDAVHEALRRGERLARVEGMVAPLKRRRLLWRIPPLVARLIAWDEARRSLR